MSTPETPAAAAPVDSIRRALSKYRTLAWITGAWLLVLCAEMVAKYIFRIDYPWFKFIGMLHGAFYMLYVFFTLDLAVKVRWPLGKAGGIILAGTVPLLGIIVEHFQTQDVKKRFGL
jgi:integral membrane protein